MSWTEVKAKQNPGSFQKLRTRKVLFTSQDQTTNPATPNREITFHAVGIGSHHDGCPRETTPRSERRRHRQEAAGQIGSERTRIKMANRGIPYNDKNNNNNKQSIDSWWEDANEQPLG